MRGYDCHFDKMLSNFRHLHRNTGKSVSSLQLMFSNFILISLQSVKFHRFRTQKKRKSYCNSGFYVFLCCGNVVARLHSLSERTEVDITIVDDEEIHMLNRDYRNVDRPTDVLSFALDEESEEEPELLGGPEEHLLGDIIISAETASRQAEEFGHGLEREIVYLAVHGLLHLLGYDHMTDEDKAVMRAKEEEALREISLSEEFLVH